MTTRISRLINQGARATAVLLAGVIALRAIFFLWYSRHWPLSICLDASILRFESWSMLRGVWPWRDIVSINLPVTHYIHIFGLTLFGGDDRAFRLFDISWILSTALLTALYLGRHSLLAAWIGTALFLCLPHEATPYGAFQREVIMLPLWLGLLWLTEHMVAVLGRGTSNPQPGATRRVWPWILFGVLSVLAVGIKPTSALLSVLLGMALAIAAMRSPILRRTGAVAFLSRGAFVAGLATLGTLVFVFVPLALADSALPLEFARSWLKQTGAYAAVTQTTPPETLLLNLFTIHPFNWAIALNQPLAGPTDSGHFSLLALALLGVWVFAPGRTGRLLLLFALAALGQYLAQMRGFQYHLYPLWYALMLAAAMAIAELLKPGGPPGMFKKIQWGAVIVPPAAGLFFVISLMVQQHNSIKTYRGTGLYDTEHPEKIPRFRVPEEIGKMALAIRTPEPPRRGAPPAPELDRRVSLVTFEHASIALGAVMPNDLLFASRYPVDYIVRAKSPYRDEARAEMLARMQKEIPDIIAYSAGHAGATPEIADWPELNRWLRLYYVRAAIVQEVNGDEYRLFVPRKHAARVARR